MYPLRFCWISVVFSPLGHITDISVSYIRKIMLCNLWKTLALIFVSLSLRIGFIVYDNLNVLECLYASPNIDDHLKRISILTILLQLLMQHWSWIFILYLLQHLCSHISPFTVALYKVGLLQLKPGINPWKTNICKSVALLLSSEQTESVRCPNTDISLGLVVHVSCAEDSKAIREWLVYTWVFTLTIACGTVKSTTQCCCCVKIWGVVLAKHDYGSIKGELQT